MQMGIKFLRRLKEAHKNLENIEKAGTRVNNCKFAKGSSIRSLCLRVKFNRCMGKSLETVICINSVKILLKQLQIIRSRFLRAIVDSACGFINYHLIEILSS